MVNSPLIRPYFLGGDGIGGGTLDSHDFSPSLAPEIEENHLAAGFHHQTFRSVPKMEESSPIQAVCIRPVRPM